MGSSYGVYLWLLLEKNTNSAKKAIRCIANAQYNAHTNGLFKSYGILKLEDIYKFHLGKFMYQFTNKSLPKHLMSIFIANSQIHDHNTRQRDNAHQTGKNTALVIKSLIHKGPEQWQNLAQIIKHSRSLKAFNSSLKHNLLQSYLVNQINHIKLTFPCSIGHKLQTNMMTHFLGIYSIFCDLMWEGLVQSRNDILYVLHCMYRYVYVRVCLLCVYRCVCQCYIACTDMYM